MVKFYSQQKDAYSNPGIAFSFTASTEIANKDIEESKRAMTCLEYSCYHCNDFQPTRNVEDYERHVASKHIRNPADKDHSAYPCKADIERLGLKAQGKSWEI